MTQTAAADLVLQETNCVAFQVIEESMAGKIVSLRTNSHIHEYWACKLVLL